jgi:S-DNA-T family DNA segregation ATPase FtsK/SpoIIIE
MFTNTGKSALVGNHWKMKKKEQRRAFWLETLGACAEHALRETEEAFSPADAAAMKKVLLDVYAGLRSRAVDYPESRSNSARLEGFVTAWAAGEGAGAERAAAAAEYMQAQGMQMPELKGKTQLSALVEHLARLAKRSGCEHSFRLWLPVLPELLHLQELPGWAKNSFQRAAWPAPGGEWSLEAAVGLADNPANQAQLPLRISLSEGGHLAVCGAVVSGKSTFLQTFLFSLVNRYTPDELNIYALDFSSRVLGCFEGLAHVGGVLCEEDTDRTDKLFTMLSGILDQRKQLMRGGNYAQYVRAGGRDVPAVVIAVDNYANFREKTANKFEDTLISLSREGAGYGMFLVITSGGFGVSEIPTRIAENLRNTACLEMGDKFHYGDILRTLHFDVLPETGVRGRGLAPVNGTILEFQTAVALPAGDDYERSERMTEIFGAMNAAWKGKCARPIPSIPEKPVWSSFSKLESARELADSPRYLPFAYHLADATVCSVDLFDTYCWLIAGRAKTGKTNVLHLLMSSAKRRAPESAWSIRSQPAASAPPRWRGLYRYGRCPVRLAERPCDRIQAAQRQKARTDGTGP